VVLIQVNWEPSRRELRQFAGIWFPPFFALVGALIWNFSGSLTAALVIWSAALAVSVVGVWRPEKMRPIFVGWMVAAFPIGWMITHLLLGVVFYLVMTPIGLVMRLLRRDPMARRFDKSTATYWSPHNPGGDTARYFRQF
jgi:hypothetical protein